MRKLRHYILLPWKLLAGEISNARKRKDRSFLLSVGFVFMFLFMGMFAKFIASPLPMLIYSNNAGIAMPVSPMISQIFARNKRAIENIPYRKLTAEGKIGALFTIIPYNPYESDLDNTLTSPRLGRFTHYLGTDDLGRDVAARLIHGTSNSMMVGLVAVGIALFIGIIIGAFSGYFGGVTDQLLSRFTEIVICFPTLILIMAILAILKPSLMNIMIVIGLTGWPGIARIVRAEFLKRKTLDFVQAGRITGAGHVRLIFKYILPNSMAPVIVIAAFDIAGAVLTESALSFLGIGVPVPEPSWGDVLKTAQDFPDVAWWLTIFPGFLIFMTVVSFNLLGDWLRKNINRHENR